MFVELGRDLACEHALKHGYDWLLMFDGDATFGEDFLHKMLHTAYVTHPQADVVGAYSQLKGSYLSSIDTGTGHWEAHFPGEGVLPVIRTGGHFILIKVPLLKRFGPPWFRTRDVPPIARTMADLDNYARIKLDGQNPLSRTETWKKLAKIAREEGGKPGGSVGEDSGFCDGVLAAGGHIVVNTNIVTGHIERRVITPQILKDQLQENKNRLATTVGVLLDSV